jgi:hypothetical protein
MKSLFKYTLIVGIILMLALLIVSCSSPSTSAASNPSIETEEVVVDQTDQTDQPQAVGTDESQSAVSEDPAKPDNSVPEDVPIMSGSRKLDVSNGGTNISYEVDGTIEDVVTFYQDELPNFGWEMTRTPDNVLGAMATMARTNEKGDRMTFSLQYNSIAQFVVIRIFITRAPE